MSVINIIIFVNSVMATILLIHRVYIAIKHQDVIVSSFTIPVFMYMLGAILLSISNTKPEVVGPFMLPPREFVASINNTLSSGKYMFFAIILVAIWVGMIADLFLRKRD